MLAAGVESGFDVTTGADAARTIYSYTAVANDDERWESLEHCLVFLGWPKALTCASPSCLRFHLLALFTHCGSLVVGLALVSRQNPSDTHPSWQPLAAHVFTCAGSMTMVCGRGTWEWSPHLKMDSGGCIDGEAGHKCGGPAQEQ